MLHLSLQHALRLSAFAQLHKVLGMDPLPSKLPKKARTETPIDYTGKTHSVSDLSSLYLTFVMKV